jgi:hypothetical protein
LPVVLSDTQEIDLGHDRAHRSRGVLSVLLYP